LDEFIEWWQGSAIRYIAANAATDFFDSNPTQTTPAMKSQQSKDDNMEYPLLSIPQLAKNGNDILMTEGKVLVIDRKNEELVLDGTMDPNRGLYLVPLYHYGKENRALTVSPMNTSQKILKTAQVSNIEPQPLKWALSATEYEVKAIPSLIRFLYAAAGYPVIKTWLKAIEKNYYTGWPGLTTKRVRKYLLSSEHTAKGHLHMVRQGIKSTTKSVQVQGEPKKEHSTSPRTKEHDLGVFTINTTELEKEVPMGTPLKNLIAIDLPGRYPVTSRKGNKYMLVLYDYDSNLIIVEPIKSRNASHLVNGFDTIRIARRCVFPGSQQMLNWPCSCWSFNQ
jgi:hypothetical protein